MFVTSFLTKESPLQVGIRVMVFNNIETELLILLVLHGSDDHRFIMVEETGVVDFYRPRTMAGDHQHLVSVRTNLGLGEFLEAGWGRGNGS